MDRQRSTIVLLIAIGVLFAAYPALRPFSPETGAAGADAYASPLWVAAHVCAMLGFTSLALVVRALDAGAAAEVTTWVGVCLLLPYYGAETFALNVLGTRAQDTGDFGLIDLAEPIRYDTVQVAMFGLGLILVAVGAVALARRLGGWQAMLFAAGFVTLLPQFFGPPWVRVAHGVLILAGSLLLAMQIDRRRTVRQEMSTTTGA